MNDSARDALCQMIHRYGRSVVGQPVRCKGLLHNILKNNPRELTVLLSALDEQIPLALAESGVVGAPFTLVVQMTARLRQNQLLPEETACWAVESWGVALGVVSAAELRRKPAHIVATDSPGRRARAMPVIPVPIKIAPKYWEPTADFKRHEDAIRDATVMDASVYIAVIIVGILALHAIFSPEDSKARMPASGPEGKPFCLEPRKQ